MSFKGNFFVGTRTGKLETLAKPVLVKRFLIETSGVAQFWIPISFALPDTPPPAPNRVAHCLAPCSGSRCPLPAARFPAASTASSTATSRPATRASSARFPSVGAAATLRPYFQIRFKMTSSAIGKCASDVSGPLLRGKLLPWAAAALFSATSRAFSSASSSAGHCAQAGGAGEGASAAEGSDRGGNLAAIKELRARTGAPVKDVKAALVAAGWDLDAAFTELRRRGLAAAQKKRARVAAEGLVGVAVQRGVGAVAVEVNSETDFVARNDLFQLLRAERAERAERPLSIPCLSPMGSSSAAPTPLHRLTSHPIPPTTHPTSHPPLSFLSPSPLLPLVPSLQVSKAAAAALSLSPSSSSSSTHSSLPLPLPLANLEQATVSFDHPKLSGSQQLAAFTTCTYMPSPPLSPTLTPSHHQQTTVSFDHPKLSGSRQLAEAVAEVAALTGENVRLRRAFLLPEPRPTGSVATYLHSSPGAGLGRIASLVSLSLSQPSGNSSSSSSSSSSGGGSREETVSEAAAAEEAGGGGEGAAEAAAAVGEGVAMHVVAMRPLYLRREDVPGEVVEKESDVLRAQAVAAGKAASVVEKMVAGRLGKFYGEVVLMEQAYAMDDKRTVQKVLAEASKNAGATIQVEQFLRLEVGEGIERESKDFASEVASQVASSS
ncbi:unnamed protein product [Closterium sp. NIES-53]